MVAHESEIGDYGGRTKAVDATGRITLILSISCRVSSVRGHHFANTSVPLACKNHWALYCIITPLVHPNRQLVSSSAPSAPLGPAYRKSKYPASRERAQICKKPKRGKMFRQDVAVRFRQGAQIALLVDLPVMVVSGQNLLSVKHAASRHYASASIFRRLCHPVLIAALATTRAVPSHCNQQVHGPAVIAAVLVACSFLLTLSTWSRRTEEPNGANISIHHNLH